VSPTPVIMHVVSAARLGLPAFVLSLSLLTAGPVQAQAWLQNINRSDGAVSGVPGQTLVTIVPPGERGRCSGCRHISGCDNGFGDVTTFFGGTAWGLQEVRFAHDFTLDSLATFRASNGSGGERVRMVSEFAGVRPITRAEVAITVSATNPLTGEKKAQTDRFRIEQGRRTYTQVITVGGDEWLRLIGCWGTNNVPLGVQADSLKVRAHVPLLTRRRARLAAAPSSVRDGIEIPPHTPAASFGRLSAALYAARGRIPSNSTDSRPPRARAMRSSKPSDAVNAFPPSIRAMTACEVPARSAS